MYSVSHETRQQTFGHIFAKYWLKSGK